MRIGIISDTHGLLRPEAVEALRVSDCIIHAGDIGGSAILDELRKLAPVFAIRGNIDDAPWTSSLPETMLVEISDARIWVLHNRNDLNVNPVEAGIQMVVSGHSHKPSCETVDNVIYLNPGSAGPRRFRLPVTLALIETNTAPWKVEIIALL